MKLGTVLCTAIALLLSSPALAGQAFTTDDLLALEDISEPVFTPDGESVTYVVTKPGDGDFRQSDIWSVDWDSGEAKPLFADPKEDEYSPRYSADGSIMTYLRSHDGAVQIWRSEQGGKAQQVSHVPGGVWDYTLSPDGTQAVVLAETGLVQLEEGETPPPIVSTRFTQGTDSDGWVQQRRKHLFLLDFTNGETTQITHGEYDHATPAWSPDGQWIAFVSRRCEEADRHYCSDIYIARPDGSDERRISSFAGGDADWDFESGGPQWSPDSRQLTWIRAGEEKYTWYRPFQIVTADIETGEERTPAWIDRWFYFPRWSADGKHVLALVEQDRDTWLARIDPVSGQLDYLTHGARLAYDFAVGPDGRLAVLDGDNNTPLGLRTVEATPRPLSPQNAWVAKRTLATTQDVAFMSGDTEIHGLLVLPADHKPGQKHPLIVRLHGGPVYQYSHEFMADWQVYAANGYAVLGINPRGSSGRGSEFAQAQMANWGQLDVQDISAGISHAIALGVADPNAIGVGGWSYGGILTNYMIVSDPRIKAAVSGAGMGNFLGGYGLDQYARDYELELGTPWDEPERWMALSYPFFQADRITAPTLYLCGEVDWNVPCSGSRQMHQALLSNRVPSTLVVYPGEHHGLTVPSYIRDRMERQLDWYDLYLKGKGAE